MLGTIFNSKYRSGKLISILVSKKARKNNEETKNSDSKIVAKTEANDAAYVETTKNETSPPLVTEKVI